MDERPIVSPGPFSPATLGTVFAQFVASQRLQRSMSQLRILMLALLVPALAPGHAFAQISDSELAEQVADTINRYAQYGIFDSVDISVDHGNVTLTGRVLSPAKKNDIEARVKRIDGIRSLRNEIGVLPNSPTDRAIGQRVAQAIYNNSAF